MEKELENLRSDKPMTVAERENAGRALQRLQTQNKEVSCTSQEVLELYCALRRAKGESSRINAAQLLGWRQKLVQSSLVKRTFWLVPARNIQD